MITPIAFFLAVTPGGAGQRFCLYYPAKACKPRGAMLYAHPFAEEMNKSRRMARLQAREFANAGFAVLQIDLFGCGDSAGNFADATWDDWVNDLRCGANWLQETVAAPLWLWGLRAGCLLLAATAAGIKSPVSYLVWQPPPSGRVLLQQFLHFRA